MSKVSLETLRGLPVFADLPDEPLLWIAHHSEVRRHEAGAHLYEATDPADALVVVLEGELQLQFELGGQYLTVAAYGRGGVSGVLPFSRMTHYNVRGVASRPSEVLWLSREHFPGLLQVSPEVGQRLVSLMADRVREATRMQQQREKMMALGQLSAGLAHELNNPAAAAKRAAAMLRERLETLPTLTSRLADCGVMREAICSADALIAAGRGQREAARPALERAEAEEEIAAWLEKRGTRRAWRLAPTMVECGVTPAALEKLAEGLPEAAVGDFMVWFEASLDADRLLSEIAHATSRISDLVASVKTYSHMDRALEFQPARVHEGIDSTLTMLGHKIKKKAVRLERDYAADLPEAMALPGELNQVWTNLLDNAFDAIAEGGLVRVETARDGDWIRVRIIDDGPGIPSEVQSRIFEPFFTTKPIGQGTGLGLDMVQRIVRLHHGEVSMRSQPGRTAFTVLLPIAPSEAGSA
jgi:signal transduction histidine kinase